MEGRTVEELFAALAPEAREEAVRLAARWQDRGDEGAHLIAAAREAGITDANLRAAAERLTQTGTLQVTPVATVSHAVPRSSGPTVSLELTLAVLLAAAQLFQAWYGSNHSAQELCPPMLLLTVILGGGLWRFGRRWSGVATVAGVWALVLLPMHLMSGRLNPFGSHTLQESLAGYSMLHNIAAVAFGTLLTTAFSALRLGRRRAVLETVG